MKTIQLIDCLTTKESKEAFVVIKSADKGNTIQLFEYLVKTKNKVNKRAPDCIFKAIFKETYSPDKDYLLRNEMRLLNQLLENFIAHKKLDSREERYLFIQSIQERGLIDLFEKEVKKEIKKSTKLDDYENLARLYSLISDQNRLTQTLTKKNIKQEIQRCDNISFFQSKMSLYQAGELEVTKAYFVKNIRNLEENVDLEILDNIPETQIDDYLRYLKCKAKGYIYEGKDKLDNLKKTLELLDNIQYYKLDKAYAKIPILNNLALEYLLAQDYENAIISLEKIIDTKQISGQSEAYVLFNYLNCLLKFGAYTKAIDVIKLHFIDDNLIPPILKGKISSIKAMAWIYVGDYKRAFNEIPSNLKKGSRADYFYSRLVLSIIYHLENEADLALREIKNILQIDREKSISLEMRFAAKVFKKFFSSPFKQSKRKEILDAIHEFSVKENSSTDILPLLWLKDQLEQ